VKGGDSLPESRRSGAPAANKGDSPLGTTDQAIAIANRGEGAVSTPLLRSFDTPRIVTKTIEIPVWNVVKYRPFIV